MVVLITWPDEDLTLPSLSKLAPAGLEMEKNVMVYFSCVVVFEIKR